MNRILRLAAASAVLGTAAMAQVITPVWVEHLNGTVNVDPANVIPVLRKNVGGVETGTGVGDGSSTMVSFGRLLRYDATRFLLFVRQNGVDEANASAEDAALAAQYPDRSLVWINATTGKPMGVALTFGVEPIQATGQGNNYDFYNEWGMSEDGVIYYGHKNAILRYAKTGTDTWSSTPTCAWIEPTEANGGATDCDGNLLDGSSNGDGNQSWRWRDFRVTGGGVNTRIWGGGGTWRASQHPQLFVTTDGLKFTPISRENDRDGGYKGNYSQGGMSSRVVQYGLDPAHPNLMTVYHGRYPGTGWEARPDRFVENPDAPFRTLPDTYAPNGTVMVFETGDAWNWGYTNNNKGDVLNYPATPAGPNGQWGGLPAFKWESAGANGVPIDHSTDGVDHYDGNWSCDLDAHKDLDYVVNYAMPSWNNQFGAIKKPGWLGIHRLDGSISANAEWKLPCTEIDVQTDDEGPETGNAWGYCGSVVLYPDTTAPANLKKATLLWVGGAYGFGVFTIQNVAATVTQEPDDIVIDAGKAGTITANIAGSRNTYRWFKDGVALADGKYVAGSKKAKLTLSEVIRADGGNYQLQISNPISGVTTTRVVKVTINGAYVRPHQDVAIGGTATMDSTYPGGEAWKAIDGNTAGGWGAGSIAHNNGATNVAWWQVDLQKAYDVGRVVYWPRTDCCPDRGSFLDVVLLDANHVEIDRQTGPEQVGTAVEFTMEYAPSKAARYVRIEKAADTTADPIAPVYLNIAEVQVFAKFQPTMDIGVYNVGQVMVAWDSDAFSTPKLQKASSVAGPWTDVTTTQPYVTEIAGTTFFRVVQ